jgi:hypothetical protein
MAGSKCFALVRGRAMRVTRLDGCGAVVLGPDSQVVSDGFITVALTANTDEGTTISVTNAAGKVCILDEPCPQFTGYTAEVAFCGVDPDLYKLMTGQPVILNAAGEAVGFKMNSSVDACDSGFALEVWSNVPAAVCEEGEGQQYGYFLIPFLRGGVIGDFTIGNDAVNFTLAGASSKDGNAWDTGPYNVVPAAGGAPGKLLDGLDPMDHLHVQLTSIAPPAATCGGAALGVPATTATAGTPGTYTPANSYGPANFTSMAGLTASPTGTWTSGQYIVLGDGSLAHWNGTAWTTGAKP